MTVLQKDVSLEEYTSALNLKKKLGNIWGFVTHL